MALYHRYRPQKFADIIGQEHIVRTLSNQVAGNKIAHAYLFAGARGIGKTTTARVLAKALNCTNRKESNSEPCNTCASCLEISGSRSIDVIEIDAASHTGVDNVRENIIDSAQFRPTKSKFKIFIIDEAHMLTTPAFNALLKTLEEPPAYIIFILATTELAKLPETIISRCQRFVFHKLLFDTLKKYLEKIVKEEDVKIDKEVIARIINKSDGSARDAVGLLDQLISTGEKKIDNDTAALFLPTIDMEKSIEMINHLIGHNVKDAIILLNNLVAEGINLMQFSHDLLELLRLMLVHKASGQMQTLGVDIDEKTNRELKKNAEKISPPELIHLLDLLLERRQQIKTAPLPQLPLEMAIIEWCQESNDKKQSASWRTNNNSELISIKENKLSNAQPEIKKNIVERVKEDAVKEKKTISERVKGMVSKTAVSKEQVEAKWPEFLNTIENKFPSLAFILKMAELKTVEENVVQIAVGFSFHCDKLMEKSCQRNLEEILSGLCSAKIKIEAVGAEKNKIVADDELESIASSLGGEIIN